MTDTTKSLQSSLSRLLIEPQYRVFRHLLLITIISVISLNQMVFTFNRGLGFSGVLYYLTLFTIVMAYLAVGYLHLYFFVPRLLKKKKYIQYLLCSTGAVFVLLLFRETETFYIYQYYQKGESSPVYTVGLLDILSDFMLNMLCISGISITVLFEYWMSERQRMNELENRRLETEVEQFKDQIYPGLLLSTLHKSSELVYQDADFTSDILFRLSELLRYQLYNCNHDRVWLSAEIDFIERYLSLEKLTRAEFDYKIIDKTSHIRLLVPPMILMPLLSKCVENQEKQPGKTKLCLLLDVAGDEFTFSISSVSKELVSATDPEWFRDKLTRLIHSEFSVDVINKEKYVSGLTLKIQLDKK